MRIDILTLFPETLGDVLSESILGRAQDRGIIRIEAHQIRDYTANKQNQTDDYPYGGGRGAVMTADPLYRATGPITDSFPAAVQRICRHLGTPAASVRVIVHLILLVGSVVPDLVGFDFDEPTLLGPTQNAFGQNVTQSLREQGQNVNSHRCAYPRSASRPSGCPPRRCSE